ATSRRRRSAGPRCREWRRATRCGPRTRSPRRPWRRAATRPRATGSRLESARGSWRRRRGGPRDSPWPLFRGRGETGRSADLLAVFHAIEHFGIELALDPGVDLTRRVLPGMLLDIDDVGVAFLDDRFVGDGQQRTAFDDDLDDIE